MRVAIARCKLSSPFIMPKTLSPSSCVVWPRLSDLQRPTMQLRWLTASALDQGRSGVERRARFLHFTQIPTRWMDNDVFGHVNNVQYYSYFDTSINKYLMEAGGFDFQGEIVGYCVNSTCNYEASVSFPDVIDCGLRVGRLGNSSVRYELALFKAENDVPAAWGTFTHVFVEKATGTPVRIPDRLREVLRRLKLNDEARDADLPAVE